MAIPKKAYLLSFFSRHYHKIMKLKCKARQYLSLLSCNRVSHMTNYVNFKLSKHVEKNPGPTQYNTDHHEVIIRLGSTMQLTSPNFSENLMQSRLGELGLQSIDVGGQVIVSLHLYHINYMEIASNAYKYCWGRQKTLRQRTLRVFCLWLWVTSVLASTEDGGRMREVK